MMRDQVIVVGAVEAGKSSLISAINGEDGGVRKTQTMIYDAKTIDTPGEYMENPRMYRYIIAGAQGIKYVIFVQDSTKRRCIYPPGFAQSFNGMTIGVITKTDDPNSDVQRSREILKTLCIKGPVFETSAITGDGVQELKDYLGI